MWSDFRTEEYSNLLQATAEVWWQLARHFVSMEESSARVEAYARATLLLPQLPMEYGDPLLRFERCRWQHAAIPADAILTKLHCEHPWTKKKTRTYVLRVVTASLSSGVPEREGVAAIREILDARQDTVLMPNTSVKKLGVLTGRSDDGLHVRYAPAIAAETLRLLDRLDGHEVGVEEVRAIGRDREARVEKALRSVGTED